MPNPSWQLLFADDDSKMCEQVKDYLEGQVSRQAPTAPRYRDSD